MAMFYFNFTPNLLQILSVDENKNELNNLIATSTVELCADVESVIVLTKGNGLVSNLPVDRQRIDPCTKEEADDRMFLHAMALSREGFKKLCVISPFTLFGILESTSYGLSLVRTKTEGGYQSIHTRAS